MFRDTESCHMAGCDQLEHELLTLLSILLLLKVHFVGLSGAHQSSPARSEMLKYVEINFPKSILKALAS